MSKRRVCLFHEKGWSGQDVEYYGCDKCKAENEYMLDYLFIGGQSLRMIRDRPAP